MANRSAAGSRLIDRRTVLQVAAALAAAGPVLMREGQAAARPPVVIDAQVHAYAANTPERPWHSVPNWPAHVTGDEIGERKSAPDRLQWKLTRRQHFPYLT